MSVLLLAVTVLQRVSSDVNQLLRVIKTKKQQYPADAVNKTYGVWNNSDLFLHCKGGHPSVICNLMIHRLTFDCNLQVGFINKSNSCGRHSFGLQH